MTSTPAIKSPERGARHDASAPLLAIDELPPYAVFNPDGASPILLLCEHASNRMPRALGDMGLPDHERQRHIAWDIGAMALAQHLSLSLDAPLFFTNYSRLVIDCNRPLAAPSMIPEISETTEIPANRNLGDAERQQRIDTLFSPFANAVSRRLDRLEGEGKRPFVVGIHSFTPVYFGRPRPWQAGILYRDAVGFADSLIRELASETHLTIGDNEPYNIHPDEDYTVPVHADARGFPGVLVEVRHDLIDTDAGVTAWGERLTRCLKASIGEGP
ncbi:MAG TPA: N-formylglutamate amidohydrolase [Ensifer sp.]|jgi:predicted N-formylglutamate amidohydrolase|uniref:N-formylglutamate amidohydrolase n=1 Tax=Ensifer sp. TaxID=1872086 RepID=UPI002E12E4DE|nr:N-formylglutamate amidohydrolase [Ensifer sp.]